MFAGDHAMSPNLRRTGRCFHSFAQAQRPRICPYRPDVLKALGFGTISPTIPPPQRVSAFYRPDRVLQFVIDHDFVDGFVCFVVHIGLWV